MGEPREPTLTFSLDAVLGADGNLVRRPSSIESEYLFNILHPGSTVNTTQSRMDEHVRRWLEIGSPKGTWDNPFTYDDIRQRIITRDCSESLMGREKMPKLYEVYVIEVPEQEVVYQDAVIAKDAEQAKMKVLAEALGGMSVEPEKLAEYQFICSEIGTVNSPANG